MYIEINCINIDVYLMVELYDEIEAFFTLFKHL